MGKSRKERVNKQHFVPQSYLRLFADNTKQLHIFDKLKEEGTRIYRTSPNNIANEVFFYDEPENKTLIEDKGKQIAEKALCELEGKAVDIIREINRDLEEGRKPNLKTENRLFLAYYIAVQFLRTKEYRDLLIEISEKTFRAVADEALRLENIEGIDYEVKYDSIAAGQMQLKAMFGEQAIEMAAVLSEYIWVFGINTTTDKFYTSDHPVVKEPHKEDPILSYSGWMSEGIEIVLPLSPKHILTIFERSFFQDCEHLDGNFIPCPEESVTFYNSLQVLQSYRQVYCSENQFVFAERVCNDHPTLYTKNKGRITVSTYRGLVHISPDPNLENEAVQK